LNDIRRNKSISAQTADVLLKKMVKRANLKKQQVPTCKTHFNVEKEHFRPHTLFAKRSIKIDLINNRRALCIV